jgi:hypothetical protein
MRPRYLAYWNNAFSLSSLGMRYWPDVERYLASDVWQTAEEIAANAATTPNQARVALRWAIRAGLVEEWFEERLDIHQPLSLRRLYRLKRGLRPEPRVKLEKVAAGPPAMLTGPCPERYTMPYRNFLQHSRRASYWRPYSEGGRVLLRVEASQPYYDREGIKVVDVFTIQTGETIYLRRDRKRKEQMKGDFDPPPPRKRGPKKKAPGELKLGMEDL